MALGSFLEKLALADRIRAEFKRLRSIPPGTDFQTPPMQGIRINGEVYDNVVVSGHKRLR